jgi:hypothetical protein
MTGREAATYILSNGYGDKPLVIFIDGKPVPIWCIAYDAGTGRLVILPDYD